MKGQIKGTKYGGVWSNYSFKGNNSLLKTLDRRTTVQTLPKGKTHAIRRKFTRVKSLEFDKLGRVADWLSSQFTVNWDDGSYGFLFYEDNGTIWKPVVEEKTIDKGISFKLPDDVNEAGKVTYSFDTIMNNTALDAVDPDPNL